MPKRSNRNNNGGRYSKYAKCGSMVASDAAKALAMVRKLKGMINVEYKSVSVTIADTTPTTVAAVQQLTNISQGDDMDDRDGRKIKAFSLQLKGMVEQHASAVVTLVRILIIIDHANTGTPPTLAQLFNAEATFFNGMPKLSQPQSNSRFTVLWDKIITFSNSGTKLVRVNYYKRLHHHIKFTGAATTDEGLGTIWVITASNEATNTPELNIASIFKWIDN